LGCLMRVPPSLRAWCCLHNHYCSSLRYPAQSAGRTGTCRQKFPGSARTTPQMNRFCQVLPPCQTSGPILAVSRPDTIVLTESSIAHRSSASATLEFSRQLPSLPKLPEPAREPACRPSSRLLCQVLVPKSSMKLGHPRHLTMRPPEPSRLSGKTKKRDALPDLPLSHPNRYPALGHATAPSSSSATLRLDPLPCPTPSTRRNPHPRRLTTPWRWPLQE
jgi:hypothetical protein